IDALPAGSDISVIPLCSDSRWHARNVYATKEDALEAVNRIEIVDRAAPVTVGLAQAQRACRLASEIPTKRVVFIGDAQRRTWSPDGAEAYLQGISDIQIVQVAPAERTNTWVADFKLLHGIADTDSTAVFRATIRHEGKPRSGVKVTLTIGNAVVAERAVDLVGGHEMRLDFNHKFDVAGTSAEPLFVPAKLELSTDRLAMDNYRTLIAPVVARTPVVFIDQHGSNERPDENVFGETSRVRRLLSSQSHGPGGQKQLVRQVLRTIDQVTRDDLKEARLVVIAGVKSPSPEAVALLREYVEQGGNIFIAAGGAFDPVQWTAAAWRDGAGILPAPLKDTPVGRVPESSRTNVVSFGLDEPSIMGQALYLDTTPEETEKILASPRFFKIVVTDVAAGRNAISQVERKQIQRQRKWLTEYEANEKRWAQLERTGKLSAEEAKRRERDRLAAAAMGPNWLAWRNPLARDTAGLSVEDLVKATQPRVLGRYDNGHPFVVQREIGKGRVIMLTSGLWPSWNTLALENSVLLLDRIMRSLLIRSLPDRTFGPEQEILIPVAAVDQAADFALQGPGDDEPRLQSVEALGPRSYGLLLRSVQRRGLYRIQRKGLAGESADEGKKDAWTIMLAVNGPAEESELASLTEADVPAQIGQASISWVEADEKISLAGKTYIGHDFWKVLMLLTLACVLLEMVLLTSWRLAGLAKASGSDQAVPDQTGEVPEATR
ncbi:MAG: hypothetical protein ISS78_11530, partial [Phycisphaerae bacterium]|nr:hypothetical protein [Phycisphaerae bacterium]